MDWLRFLRTYETLTLYTSFRIVETTPFFQCMELWDMCELVGQTLTFSNSGRVFAVIVELMHSGEFPAYHILKNIHADFRK
jgi:hypothetical protein